MSPYLLKALYSQIKRVIAHDIALTDVDGIVYKEASDFAAVKRFELDEVPTRERGSIAIKGYNHLLGVPIFYEDRFYALIIIEAMPEDAQTIEVVNSLAELIIQQFVTQHKPRPDAVDLLLTRLAYRPDSIDQEELEQQMAALGYRLDVQRAAVVFELSGFWDNYLQMVGQPLGEKKNLIAAKKHDIEQGLTSFFSKNQDNIIGYIGNNRFLVLKDLSSTDFERFCRLLSAHYGEVTNSLKNVHITEVTSGIGSPTSSTAGLMQSAREAMQVLEIGKSLFGANKAHRIDSLGVLPLLISSTSQQKKDYSDRLLGDLEDEELMETLQAFLDSNLNLTQTAELLKIHRNTVIYRLDKITERIGKDPRSFTDAVELYLATLFDRVFSGK